MLIQPFDLPDPVVAGVVESAWGVAVESIEYAPVGFGSHHWRLSDGAQEWFVTVDVASFSGRSAAREAASRLDSALSGARQLHDLRHSSRILTRTTLKLMLRAIPLPRSSDA